MSVWNIALSANDGFDINGSYSGVDNDLGYSRVGSSTTSAGMNMGTYGKTVPQEFGSVVTTGTDVDPIIAANALNPANSIWNEHSRLGIHGTGANTTTNTYVWNSAISRTPTHRTRTVRTRHTKLAIQANSWNEYTATWDAGTPELAASGMYSTDTSANASGTSVDDETQSSRALPGNLAFRDGSPTVVTSGYPARTN